MAGVLHIDGDKLSQTSHQPCNRGVRHVIVTSLSVDPAKNSKLCMIGLGMLLGICLGLVIFTSQVMVWVHKLQKIRLLFLGLRVKNGEKYDLMITIRTLSLFCGVQFSKLRSI